MKKLMIRYPHGFFKGGIEEKNYIPTITASCFEFNNYVLEIYDDPNKGAE